MDETQVANLQHLSQRRWEVRLCAPPIKLPEVVAGRYPWLPQSVQEFIEATRLVVAPDAKSWFVTSGDILGTNASAYCWNEWELQSLGAADGDAKWQAEIRQFWDQHFPVILSVKSGYAYFAVRQSDLAIVAGEEPEYEECTQFASSFDELLSAVASASPALARWI